MSTAEPANNSPSGHDQNLKPAEPLTPVESYLAQSEALSSSATQGDILARQRHGRVEAEGRRISEDMARRAHERKKAEAQRQREVPERAAPIPASGTWRLPESLAFKHILVPLDGSLLAEQEVAVAGRIGLASRARVLLARVVNARPIPDTPSPGAEEAYDASLAVATDYLRKVARQDALVDVEVHKKVLTGTPASAALHDAIDLYGCDLVVIGSHRRTGIARVARGSIARRLVQAESIPVLILASNAPLVPAESGSGRTLRALVPLDGSVPSEAALVPTARVVAALAGPGHGALHLLRVVDTTRIHPEAQTTALPYHEARQAAKEEAHVYLHRVAERFKTGDLAVLGLHVDTAVVDDVDATCAILDAAAGTDESIGSTAYRYDLIGMATHGRTGLRRLALGSVAEEVLGTSHLPLLVVRPQQ